MNVHGVLEVTITGILMVPVVLFGIFLSHGLSVQEAFCSAIRLGYVSASFIPLLVLVEKGPGRILECLPGRMWKRRPLRR